MTFKLLSSKIYSSAIIRKLILIFFLLYFLQIKSFSQSVCKDFNTGSLITNSIDSTKIVNKIIPAQYSKAINIALQYYPELNNISIKFKEKKQLSPLSARPTIGSIFLKSSKRKYIINISFKTIEKLNQILLKNLIFNSQIGVIGHELSHVSEYNSKNGFFFIKLFSKHLSKNSIDKFEYNTDKRCIEHSLGYQLLSWSEEVRKKLQQSPSNEESNSKLKRERYMSPDSIIKTMKSLEIYKPYHSQLN